jgi:hypothetical protein
MAELIPSWVKYKVSNFEVYTPTVATQSQSLKVIARSFPTHQYRCKLEIAPVKRKTYGREFAAWQESVSGRAKTISVQIPDRSNCRGLLYGTVEVDGNYAYGLKSITLSTPLISVNNAVKAGDCLSFGSHTKVYTVLQDASTNGAGKVTVLLTLPLLKNIDNLNAVVYDNVPFIMRQMEDVQSFKIDAGSLHTTPVLDLEEDI